MTLSLLTAEDCHLCEHGKDVLADLAAQGLVDWRDVPEESEEGARLASTAPPLRPVLFRADGSVLACGRLSAKRLRRELERHRA